MRTKWIVGTTVTLALALVILFLLGRKTFHAEITIDATPAEVWSVLTDVSGYADWNPLLVPISGEILEGAEVVYRMTQPNGTQSTMTSRIGKVIALEELHQHAGIPGILTAHHSYRLEPTQGGTRLIQHEVDNGIAMLFWDSSWVQPTYEKVNQALKLRVEGLRESQQ